MKRGRPAKAKTNEAEMRVDKKEIQEEGEQNTQIEQIEEVGILCPLCRGHMRVYYTKPIPNGKVQRVRICERCNHKKPTTEE